MPAARGSMQQQQWQVPERYVADGGVWAWMIERQQGRQLHVREGPRGSSATARASQATHVQALAVVQQRHLAAQVPHKQEGKGVASQLHWLARHHGLREVHRHGLQAGGRLAHAQHQELAVEGCQPCVDAVECQLILQITCASNMTNINQCA